MAVPTTTEKLSQLSGLIRLSALGIATINRAHAKDKEVTEPACPSKAQGSLLTGTDTRYLLRSVELKTFGEMFNNYFVAMITGCSPESSIILFIQKKALNITNKTSLASNYFPLYYTEYKIIFPLNAGSVYSCVLHSSSFIPQLQQNSK